MQVVEGLMLAYHIACAKVLVGKQTRGEKGCEGVMGHKDNA